MMRWSKGLGFIAMFLFIAQSLFAQQHHNIWLRSTLSLPVNNKIKFDSEFQHRRQEGFDNHNVFDENLMFSFRNWIHFQYHEDIKFSVSPFAYFSNYKIIQTASDETAQPNGEIRFSIAMDVQKEIFKKLFGVFRAAPEYRMLSNPSIDVIRWRNRFGLGYDLSKKLKVGIYDEHLFNVAGVTKAHFFDQNRVGLNVEFKATSNIKFDFGYLHLTRLPLKSNAKLYENDLFFNFTYLIQRHQGA